MRLPFTTPVTCDKGLVLQAVNEAAAVQQRGLLRQGGKSKEYNTDQGVKLLHWIVVRLEGIMVNAGHGMSNAQARSIAIPGTRVK
jgi:hypothetical protein